MSLLSESWSDTHTQMGRKIRNSSYFERTMDIVLDLHAELHRSSVSGQNVLNKLDIFFTSLPETSYAAMPSAKGTSVAWSLWHIARIEDLTMNLLVAQTDQVFNARWQKRLGVSVTDTGNAMTTSQIQSFSFSVSPQELLLYRDEVGSRSREVVRSLTCADMKRKVLPRDIERVRSERCLAEHPDSLWLLEFWGKKDVAGLLLMPLTRHQTFHLKDCEKYAGSLVKKGLSAT